MANCAAACASPFRSASAPSRCSSKAIASIRCWAPSCRSRSTRRRCSSPTSTGPPSPSHARRRHRALSARRPDAAAIAVGTSRCSRSTCRCREQDAFDRLSDAQQTCFDVRPSAGATSRSRGMSGRPCGHSWCSLGARSYLPVTARETRSVAATASVATDLERDPVRRAHRGSVSCGEDDAAPMSAACVRPSEPPGVLPRISPATSGTDPERDCTVASSTTTSSAPTGERAQSRGTPRTASRCCSKRSHDADRRARGTAGRLRRDVRERRWRRPATHDQRSRPVRDSAAMSCGGRQERHLVRHLAERLCERRRPRTARSLGLDEDRLGRPRPAPASPNESEGDIHVSSCPSQRHRGCSRRPLPRRRRGSRVHHDFPHERSDPVPADDGIYTRTRICRTRCSSSPAVRNWSPDGTQIAYQKATDPDPNDNQEVQNIYVARPDGSDERQLTPPIGDSEKPSWSRTADGSSSRPTRRLPRRSGYLHRPERRSAPMRMLTPKPAGRSSRSCRAFARRSKFVFTAYRGGIASRTRTRTSSRGSPRRCSWQGRGQVFVS